MQNIFKCKINLVIIALFLWSNVLLAQDLGEDPGDFGGDPGAPAAPLNDSILYLIFGALVLGVYFLKKNAIKSSY